MARPRKSVTTTEATSVAVENSEPMVLTADEIAAIQAIRAKTAQQPAGEPSVAITDLAQALIQAINSTKPPDKKTVFNRKAGDPWRNKDGTPKPKLKRPLFQHAIEVSPAQLFSEQILLANQVKPGRYMEGHVRVTKRNDGGIDIDYPIKTAAQRLKLVNTFGIRNFTDLLQRLIDEKANPAKYRRPEEDEDE